MFIIYHRTCLSNYSYTRFGTGHLTNSRFIKLCLLTNTEASKLRKHLELLREEYVKLQGRLATTEKKYQVASAAAGNKGPKDDENHFVAKLLRTVAELFNKSQYR